MNDIILGEKIQFNYYVGNRRIIASGIIRATNGELIKVDVNKDFTTLPKQVTITKDAVYEEPLSLNITK